MRNTILFFAFILLISASVHGATEENSVEAVTNETMPPSFFDDEKLIAAAESKSSSAGDNKSSKADDKKDIIVDRQAGPEEEDNVDPRVLRDFIESKGLIQCRQKEGNLTIAGDVRARWLATGEELDDVKQRGFGTPVAINRFKSEFSLYLDYVGKRTWVSTKTRFSAFMGRESGSPTTTALERAFIGYDIFEKDKTDFYVEIGRTNLDFLFESKVEFSSIFDGIHLFYTRDWPCVGQFTLHGGPFIVDSFTNHYAWALETYITKIFGTDFSVKYSIIDWFRHAPTLNFGNLLDSGKVLVTNNPRYRFVVSQWLVGYEREIDFIKCKTLFVYGAYLHNWAARGSKSTNGKKLNNAWYVGFTLGKLCKACDWSIDINYQYVQAQAVPEFDLNGIGHGNVANGLLSDAILLGLPPDKVRLFTNYRGFSVNTLYALTDTLSLRAQAQYTVPADGFIGGHFKYKAFEMAVIYAF